MRKRWRTIDGKRVLFFVYGNTWVRITKTPSRSILKLKELERLNKEAHEKFEALEHNKENGFYCKDADMYFEDLGDWLKYHGYGWQDVAPGM